MYAFKAQLNLGYCKCFFSKDKA